MRVRKGGLSTLQPDNDMGEVTRVCKQVLLRCMEGKKKKRKKQRRKLEHSGDPSLLRWKKKT